MKASALGRLRSASGCSIAGDALGGFYDAVCPDLQAKLDLLDAAAWEDIEDPRVHAAAAEIERGARSDSAADLARAIHAWVVERIRFAREEGERFQSAGQTLRSRVGDCDCHTRLVLALARRLGVFAKFGVMLASRGGGHIAPQLWDGAGWCWAETTVRARFGEHPLAAKQRLQLGAERPDLIGLGLLGELGGVDDAEDGYGKTTLEAVKALDDPRIQATLSTPGKMLSGAMSTASTELLGFDISKMSVKDLESAVVSAVVEMSKEILVEALKSLAKELGKESTLAIPYIGVLVYMAFDLVDKLPKAQGIGPASSDINERSRWCKAAEYRPARGSGPGNKVMPADYFVSPTYNAFFETGTPSVGYAFESLLEQDLPRPPKFNATTQKVEYPAGRVGVPPFRQAVYKKLRMAIAASFKRGDGGQALFAIYLDMARHEFESGTLNDDIAYRLFDNDAFAINPKVARRDLGESTCAYHDTRALQEALELIRGWSKTVAPAYPSLDDPPFKGQDLVARVRENLKRRPITARIVVSPVASGKIAPLSRLLQKSGKLTDLELRALLLRRWNNARTPAPTLAAVQAVQAIARGESGNDAARLGSVHCSSEACRKGVKSGKCPPGTVLVSDSHENGTKYKVCLHHDSTPEAAVDRFLRALFNDLDLKAGIHAALLAGDATAIAAAMHIPPGGYHETAIPKYADAIAKNALDISKNLKEPLAVRKARGLAVVASEPLAWVGLGLGGVALASASYIYREPIAKAARKALVKIKSAR